MICGVILGAAVRPDGTPSATLRLRATHGAALWRTGRVQMLCCTGGRGRHGPPEARVAADLLRAAGVPGVAILLEEGSTSTLGNIAEARALLPDGARLVLISNRWHLPRAALIAAALGLRVSVSGPRGTAPWSATLRAVAREAAALPVSLGRALRLRWGRRSGR